MDTTVSLACKSGHIIVAVAHCRGVTEDCHRAWTLEIMATTAT
jgi:hypothetical protein